jgi:Uncharacterized protein conserved in bacteria
MNSHTETDFEPRFGFKRPPDTCWVRFLDPRFQPSGVPGGWMALPFETLIHMDLPRKLLISENRVPILSLPAYQDTLAIWGGGGAATLLARESWVTDRKIHYWGDLDCHGLFIYGNFKAIAPGTKKFLMDEDTLLKFSTLVGSYKDRLPPAPKSLDHGETALFNRLASEQLRLEQERIPHKYVLAKLEQHGFEHICQDSHLGLEKGKISKNSVSTTLDETGLN